MNTGCIFTRMLAGNNILVIRKGIVKKAFGYKADGKKNQQPSG
ncbi:MAG TPA: hypothetical protein VGB71_15260 [Flavisolibacter sp.]